MPEKRVMIVAGEASGDLHGSLLVKSILQQQHNITFFGVGGRALQDTGVDLIFESNRLSVVGLFEVISHFKDIKKAFELLEEQLRSNRPDLLILIDFPDFNLRLAAKAKKYKIPVFYYISPQVWAWRSGRVQKIRNLVDRMAVILPFEKQFYEKKGLAVDFVGHPLLDIIPREITHSELEINADRLQSRPVIGILPGSRKKEIKVMLPIFLETAGMFVANGFTPRFILPLAPGMSVDMLEQAGLCNHDNNIEIVTSNRYEAMASCDIFMAASGTVTLELAILGKPMIVAYKMSPLTYALGSLLVKVDYASLVNIIGGKLIVPELLQHQAQPEKIFSEMVNILHVNKYTAMRKNLLMVVEKLGNPGASERAARIVLEMLG